MQVIISLEQISFDHVLGNEKQVSYGNQLLSPILWEDMSRKHTGNAIICHRSVRYREEYILKVPYSMLSWTRQYHTMSKKNRAVKAMEKNTPKMAFAKKVVTKFVLVPKRHEDKK